MNNEKVLTQAIVESIVHCTGHPPRKTMSIAPVMTAWFGLSLLALAIGYLTKEFA